jgi:hypothetical protein
MRYYYYSIISRKQYMRERMDIHEKRKRNVPFERRQQNLRDYTNNNIGILLFFMRVLLTLQLNPFY